jgi:glucosamine--fructose-6-phosphate aminotransferase (isomerizing)
MCGIFGLISSRASDLSHEAIRAAIDMQFRLADSRGKEAAGCALKTSQFVEVYKQPVSGRQMIRQPAYREHMKRVAPLIAHGSDVREPVAIIGHSRLVTNGHHFHNDNNQPVQRDDIVAIHNGIIVNDQQLWQTLPDKSAESEIDTEILLCLVRHFLNKGKALTVAVREAFALIEGAASVALLFGERSDIVLATNTGSLYYALSPERGLLVFASEITIMRRLLEQGPLEDRLPVQSIQQLCAGDGMTVALSDLTTEHFHLDLERDKPLSGIRPILTRPLSKTPEIPQRAVDELRRCVQCVLPETMPFISFNEEGVCSFCQQHTPLQVDGPEALAAEADRLRRSDGAPDCLVAFSGGRDSTYSLHYIKTVLKLNPIAFTYDWGMVTDLARRNQARVCGKLGVEHILISADIAKKRRNIQANVKAWLRRPVLGMIPILMAGDKHLFQHANRLMQEYALPRLIMARNPFEKTHFKTGFCGVDEAQTDMYFHFPLSKKLQITRFYLIQYLLNPRYFNRSIADTAQAFISSFVLKHEYLMFDQYIRWNEEEVNDTIIDAYGWETSPDIKSTWRIGDGTAAFYNYAYHTIAGFSENDTFRSHQIREGDITRGQAVDLIEEENRPRVESMQWYADTVGFDLAHAVSVINKAPKLGPANG